MPFVTPFRMLHLLRKDYSGEWRLGGKWCQVRWATLFPRGYSKLVRLQDADLHLQTEISSLASSTLGSYPDGNVSLCRHSACYVLYQPFFEVINRLHNMILSNSFQRE